MHALPLFKFALLTLVLLPCFAAAISPQTAKAASGATKPPAPGERTSQIRGA